MKKIKYFKPFILVIFGLFFFSSFYSCEEDEIDYTNQYVIDGDIGLTYTNIDTYPYQKEIVTDAPSFTIDHAVYGFSIKDVKLSDGTSTGLGDFSIDYKTGIITIDNSKGDIIPGETYSFNIGVDNVNGTILETNAFVMGVFDIPLDYTITTDVVEVEFLDELDIATITYVDTSTGGNVVEDVTYSLKDAPAGFTIDADTGVISKDTNADSGVYKLTVIIDSNVGSKTFADVLTVTVGEAPSLQYVQADGTTPLSNVVLSPWTEYQTEIPQLNGMTVATLEIILPQGIEDEMVIIKNDGRIKVREDKDIPEGVYSLGVIATNSSGTVVTFENVFSLTVEAHWDVNPVFTEDFNNVKDPVDPNAYNAALMHYDLYGSAQSFTVENTINDKVGKEKDLFTAKLSDDGKNSPDELVDAALVLELAMQADWRKMRVSFNEDFGWGDDRLDWYERSFQSGYDVSDLETGTFDNSNWTTIMAPNDWSGVSGWGDIHVDSDLNVVPFQDVVITPGNASVYLNWRVQKTGPTTGKGAGFFIDEIRVEVSKAFAAEEF